MLLDKELFYKIAEEAAKSPRLRKNYDLRDSEGENGNVCSMFFCLEQKLLSIVIRKQEKLWFVSTAQL